MGYAINSERGRFDVSGFGLLVVELPVVGEQGAPAATMATMGRRTIMDNVGGLLFLAHSFK